MTDSRKQAALKDIRAGFTALFQARESNPDGQSRRVTRLRCTYPVQCVVGEASTEAVVCDMSTGGMCLQLTQRLKPGKTVAVRYETGGAPARLDVDTVNTQVVWCRKNRGVEVYRAGVRYADADHLLARSWVKLILRELGLDVAGLVDRRKSLRINVAKARVAARLAAGRHALECVIVNLGAAGCLLEATRHVLPGTVMQIQIGPLGGLPALNMSGRVVRMAKTSDLRRWHLTVQFEAMSSVQVEHLGRYLVLVLNESHDT